MKECQQSSERASEWLNEDNGVDMYLSHKLMKGLSLFMDCSYGSFYHLNNKFI